MDKNLKKVLIVVFFIVAVELIFFGYSFIKSFNKSSSKVEEVKEEDKIKEKGYDYVLYKNKSDLYKDYFKELKKELLKDEVNDEEYAKIISKLFVVDFYSLDDKLTSTDVGGLDFIYEPIKENFLLKATDTIYKNIESNVYGDRKQELPKIKAVEVKTITPKIVTVDNLNDQNSYTVTLSITYKKDLNYPKDVTLTLVHVLKKVFIIEVK